MLFSHNTEHVGETGLRTDQYVAYRAHQCPMNLKFKS